MRFAMHLEMDKSEVNHLDKLRKIKEHFSASRERNDLFGTCVLFAPQYTYQSTSRQLRDHEKLLKSHASVNNSMEEATLDDVAINNTINTTTGTTLHQALMEVKSITKKIVIKDGK